MLRPRLRRLDFPSPARRGCTAHKNSEYTGPKSNSMEDEQCVKVQSVKIAGPDADTVLRDSLATLKK